MIVGKGTNALFTPDTQQTKKDDPLYSEIATVRPVSARIKAVPISRTRPATNQDLKEPPTKRAKTVPQSNTSTPIAHRSCGRSAAAVTPQTKNALSSLMQDYGNDDE